MRLSSSVATKRREGIVVARSAGRPRSGVDKSQAILDARKAAFMKKALEGIHGSKTLQDHRTIYIGNLSPYVTKADVIQKFSPCGEILDVQLRCSQGGLTSCSKPDDPGYFSDVHYASIIFSEFMAGHNAMKLNGSYIRGCRIIVSLTIAFLPELRETLEYQTKKLYEGKDPLSDPARRLKAEPTEIIPLGPPPDNHRLFNVSFPKCII